MKYFGTKKGEIIKLIAVDDIRQWGEIRDALGLTNESLKPLTKAMKKEGILEESGSNFRVEYDLWLAYKAFFGDEWAKNKISELEKERQEQLRLEQRFALLKREKVERYLKYRIREWIKFKNIEVEPDCSHIYLEGEDLTPLIRDLIPLTQKELLVVNPYVEKCTLCEHLIDASNKGVKVTLVTQKPTNKYNNKREVDKIKFHNSIKESPIDLYYNDSVHAKLFILDNQVLTASSMNLYSESLAGKLWEAGIVTTDPSNIKRVKQSLDELLKHPETKQQ